MNRRDLFKVMAAAGTVAALPTSLQGRMVPADTAAVPARTALISNVINVTVTRHARTQPRVDENGNMWFDDMPILNAHAVLPGGSSVAPLEEWGHETVTVDQLDPKGETRRLLWDCFHAAPGARHSLVVRVRGIDMPVMLTSVDAIAVVGDTLRLKWEGVLTGPIDITAHAKAKPILELMTDGAHLVP